MSSVLQDIGDTVLDTLNGAKDGDIGSIITIAAVAYGGVLLAEQMAAGSTVTTMAEAPVTGSVVGETSVIDAGVGATEIGAGAAEAGAAGVEGAASAADIGANVAGTSNVNVGLLEGTEAGANLGNAGVNLGSTDALSLQTSTLDKAADSSWIDGLLDSKYAAPAAIIGGNVLSSGISAAEARRIEEERIKERNEEQSGGYTRSGRGIDLRVGDRAANVIDSYQEPTAPTRYVR